MNNKKTNAEYYLEDCGFSLEETKHITINSELSYTSFKYIRYFDNDNKMYPEMTITFDPSQNSIELWNYQNAVFLDAALAAAIHMRSEELNQEVGRLIPKERTVSYLTDSLTGILKSEYDYDEAREEALREKYEITD